MKQQLKTHGATLWTLDEKQHSTVQNTPMKCAETHSRIKQTKTKPRAAGDAKKNKKIKTLAHRNSFCCSKLNSTV